MKILIVGAGVAGLSSAIFLKESHHQVRIIEKAHDWKHQGYLISLWDSGRDMLKKLGIAEWYDHEASMVQRYTLRGQNGNVIREIDLERFRMEYGGSASVIPREKLHEWLRVRTGESTIEMGKTVIKLERRGTKTRAYLSDETYDDYDLIVAGDGVNSAIRLEWFNDVKLEYEKWRVWYMWLNESTVDGKCDPTEIAEYVDADRLVAVMKHCGRDSAWCMAPHSVGDREPAEGRVQRIKQLFKNSIISSESLERLYNEDIAVADLVKIDAPEWYRKGVVLVGDAAHALGPHAGLGSTLAMEDAYVLSSELLKIDHISELPRAMLSYTEKRKARVRHAEHATAIVRLGTMVHGKFMRMLINFGMQVVPDKYIVGDIESLLKQEI